MCTFCRKTFSRDLEPNARRTFTRIVSPKSRIIDREGALTSTSLRFIAFERRLAHNTRGLFGGIAGSVAAVWETVNVRSGFLLPLFAGISACVWRAHKFGHALQRPQRRLGQLLLCGALMQHQPRQLLRLGAPVAQCATGTTTGRLSDQSPAGRRFLAPERPRRHRFGQFRT